MFRVVSSILASNLTNFRIPWDYIESIHNDNRMRESKISLSHTSIFLPSLHVSLILEIASDLVFPVRHDLLFYCHQRIEWLNFLPSLVFILKANLSPIALWTWGRDAALYHQNFNEYEDWIFFKINYLIKWIYRIPNFVYKINTLTIVYPENSELQVLCLS